MALPGKEAPNKGTCSVVARVLITVAFFGYISLGAYVFLVIESHSLAIPHEAPSVESVQPEESFSTSRDTVTREVLDKLWDITENLNILYKENWTRLASEEILKLHDALIKQPHNAAAACPQPSPSQQEVMWSYSTAFLYALALLTTLGSCPILPQTVAGKILTIFYATLGIPFMLLYLNIVGTATSSIIRRCSQRLKPARPEACRLQPSRSSCPPDIFSPGSSSIFMEKACETSFTSNLAGEDLPQGPYVVKLPDKSRYLKPELDDCNHRETTSKSSLLPDKSLGVTGEQSSSPCWPLFVCLVIVLFYWLVGALCFSYLLSCSLLDGMLVSFLLLTTAGIPQSHNSAWQQSAVVAAITLYVLCGLSLLSVCFNVLYDHIISTSLRHTHKRIQ